METTNTEINKAGSGLPAATCSPESAYLLSTKSYVGNDLLFWRREGRGYTTNIDEAERFTLEEAKLRLDSGKLRAWKLSYLEGKVTRTVDVQRIQLDQAIE